MNKNDLTLSVRESVRLKIPSASIGVIQATIDTLFQLIMESVSEGDPVVITGFGKFESVRRSERVGRNPRTGDRVVIPAKSAPVFQPGKDFKRLVESGSVEE